MPPETRRDIRRFSVYIRACYERERCDGRSPCVFQLHGTITPRFFFLAVSRVVPAKASVPPRRRCRKRDLQVRLARSDALILCLANKRTYSSFRVSVCFSRNAYKKVLPSPSFYEPYLLGILSFRRKLPLSLAKKKERVREREAGVRRDFLSRSLKDEGRRDSESTPEMLFPRMGMERKP